MNEYIYMFMAMMMPHIFFFNVVRIPPTQVDIHFISNLFILVQVL